MAEIIDFENYKDKNREEQHSENCAYIIDISRRHYIEQLFAIHLEATILQYSF